ncbi:hypothetical protein MD484_g8698, partial [Candolleomyces efflorescens]
MRAIAEEIQYYNTEFFPAANVVTPVAWLYQELVHVVQSFPSLENARFWLHPMPHAPDAPRVIEYARYIDLIIRNDRTERVQHFDAALLSFLKRIGRPNCLGVAAAPPDIPDLADGPSSVEYKVHRGIHDVVTDMQKQAQIVAHHLSVLDNCPEPTRRPVVEEEWEESDNEEGDSKHNPVASALCSMEDLIARYQDIEPRPGGGEGADNAEINRQALDCDFGRIRVGVEGPSEQDSDEEEDDIDEQPDPKRRRVQ